VEDSDMTTERKYNEEDYNNRKIEGDNIKNATICDEIADDSLLWNPNEAAYWRKKAIEHMENQYGKNHIASTVYYDKLVNDLWEKGSFRQALKWNEPEHILSNNISVWHRSFMEKKVTR